MSTLSNETKSNPKNEPNATTNPNQTFTMEDLTDLVKAIKFAYPDYGIRKVHREIVEVASVQGNEPMLKNVKLNEVKKIWKKVGLSDFQGSRPNHSAGGTKKSSTTDLVPNSPVSSSSSSSLSPLSSTVRKDEKNTDVNADSILKFYTVGDGSIQSLTKGYESAAAAAAEAAAAAAAASSSAAMEQERKNNVGEWYHFFLNVPADRSGTKPHQALINFSDGGNPDPKSNGGSSSGSVSAKNRPGIELVKIQVAAAIPGEFQMPMLLYNSDRSIRTFIHPPDSDEKGSSDNDVKDDGGGYHAIQKLILSGGSKGAMGKGGGNKGYFRCKIYKEKNVVSIDVSSLAPAPAW